MDDLLSEFLTETAESLAVIDVQLVEFEKNPNDKDILGNIFRLVHTIKGTCGFLGLPRLESVAHAGENVLGQFRDGKLEVTPEAVTLILRCIDQIRELLDELEASGSEPEGEDTELIAALNAMADGETPNAAAPAAEAPAPSGGGGPAANEFGAPVAAELLAEVEQAQAAGVKPASQEQLEAEMAAERAAEGDATSSNAPAANEFGAPVAAELLAEVEEAQAAGVKAASQEQLDADLAAEREKEAAAAGGGEATPPATQASPPAKTETKAPPAKAEGGKDTSVAASSIRVNVDVLENLMTLVSELVLTRNALLQMVRGMEDHEFTVPLQRLSHITSDLQEGVMKTRMQPIGNAWAKLPRIVRDLSIESNKKIELVMKGAETELDRQVLDLIKDPLTHMVRNSADHGLEDTPGRAAAEKPETGTILLNAFHEGGHIIIQISDDGRGLNMDRIRQKCLENGLASDAELESLTDQQVQQYIFKAGFSTAEKVTSVSGRGVGMDVVRTNIEKIGGTIELKSTEGQGTIFTIKIPLTLAIVSALIVEVCGERFAIPQISVLELVRASSKSDLSIEMIADSPVLRLRDRLLPLISAGNLLELNDDPIDLDDDSFIVVTQVGANTFGLIVDKVFDTEEIVVKPVSPVLRNIEFYSGNTILGDGSVIMILDPNGIASAAGQISNDEAKAGAHTSEGSSDDQTTSLLIFKAGGDEPRAVPLALIARLEEVDPANVETVHGQAMVQYRGQLMPLIPLDPGHKVEEGKHQPVLVFTDRERSMGLVVDEIVDIVEDELKIEIAAEKPGVIGSAIVNGRATDIVDAGYYLVQAFEDWFEAGDSAPLKLQGPGGKRALLVDDSPFFRNLLTPLLSVAGWKVTAVSSGDDALACREKGDMFDVIISDIEMPGMNGFEFAEAVRGDGRWQDVPMVALSGHVSEAAIERGRGAGFNDYLTKHDRDALVASLAQTVATVSRPKE